MIHVRAATPVDGASWLRMRCALWPEDAEAAHAQELAKFFAGQSHEPLAVLLAVDAAGEAVGFVELSIRSIAEGCETDRVAYLEGWYVDPKRRRQGVGRALIRAAEEWGRGRGCTEFGSDTQIWNRDSAAAHRALGFDEVEQLRCFRKSL
jgi:aminoglycoside 6'-N-acetyltransferase I